MRAASARCRRFFRSSTTSLEKYAKLKFHMTYSVGAGQSQHTSVQKIGLSLLAALFRGGSQSPVLRRHASKPVVLGKAGKWTPVAARADTNYYRRDILHTK